MSKPVALNVPAATVEAFRKRGAVNAWCIQDMIEHGELKKYPRGKNHEVLY